MKDYREADASERWAIVLAGGEGSRLSELTKRIAGRTLPKQFCRVIGESCLLEQTHRRVCLTLPEERVLTVVNRAHEPFYRHSLAALAPSRLLEQPEARGTAAAIVYGLMRVAKAAPTASVAIFPSDHYVDNDAAFMRHVDAAFDAVERRREMTVLLGIRPDSPQSGYGWIEPAHPLTTDGAPVLAVRRFWEKPAPAAAQELMASGCLWNSFVMVGRVATLLGMVIRARPTLYAGFASIRTTFATPREKAGIESLYARLPPVDFSAEILANAINLGVLVVHGVAWSDLGEPARVMETLSRIGIHPQWAAA